MKPGDVVLVTMPQTGRGSPKLRPALFLAPLPGPYQDMLLCGISTQLHQQQPQWDELIQSADADFKTSGLHNDSVVRLSYLHAAENSEIRGVVGRIDPARLSRLRTRLSDHLRP